MHDDKKNPNTHTHKQTQSKEKNPIQNDDKFIKNTI